MKYKYVMKYRYRKIQIQKGGQCILNIYIMFEAIFVCA